jgi:hypothetical protein
LFGSVENVTNEKYYTFGTFVRLVTGHYDIRLTDAEGRTCVVKNVTLESGKAYAFSISEADVKDCPK